MTDGVYAPAKERVDRPRHRKKGQGTRQSAITAAVAAGVLAVGGGVAGGIVAAGQQGPAPTGGASGPAYVPMPALAASDVAFGGDAAAAVPTRAGRAHRRRRSAVGQCRRSRCWA
jgi:hypothetical protein